MPVVKENVHKLLLTTSTRARPYLQVVTLGHSSKLVYHQCALLLSVHPLYQFWTKYRANCSRRGYNWFVYSRNILPDPLDNGEAETPATTTRPLLRTSIITATATEWQLVARTLHLGKTTQ